jgi:hypothetical protein
MTLDHSAAAARSPDRSGGTEAIIGAKPASTVTAIR